MTVTFNLEEIKLIQESAKLLPPQSREAYYNQIVAQMRPRRCDLIEAIRRSLNYLQHPNGDQNNAA